MLDEFQYGTALGKSLRNSLSRFRADELLRDIRAARRFYDAILANADVPWLYRIKSTASYLIKYDRYAQSYAVERVFNDILSFRVVVDSYDSIKDLEGAARISDMRRGKKMDDGYRGLHAYYQKDHFCYPVEVQYNTCEDRWLNDMLHKYLYKKGAPSEIGAKLRELYETGEIRDEEGFRRGLNVLLGRE